MNGGSSRPIAVGLVVALSAMMCVVGGSSGSGIGTSGRQESPHAIAPLPSALSLARIYHGTRMVFNQQFPGTLDEYLIASHGTEVLSTTLLANYSVGLYLSYAHNNTSRPIGLLPGGSGGFPEGVIAGGNRFFVADENFTTSLDTFEEISLSGTISTVALPIGPSLNWIFPYGNSTSFFASCPGYLVEINAMTRAMVANYSHLLPSLLVVQSLMPSGNLLYLAGDLESKNLTTSSLYFGAINTTSGTLTRISKIHYHPSGYAAIFISLGMAEGYVYVGGGLEYLPGPTVGTTEGYLYRYSPTTGTFTNESFRLPVSNEWIWAIDPWKTTALLYAQSYTITVTGTTENLGVYKLGPSGNLLNKSALLPADFYGDAGINADSGDYAYLAGSNTVSGLAELVGIPT
jgi:hypothetical protein